VLLSRVAERVYWAGRYLERAEATARIVKAHTELYLDLPRSAGMGWAPLLAITGADHDFAELGSQPTEESVIAFLTFDARNCGSLMASLNRARENMRTTRGVFPREAWEILNDLFLTAAETSEDVVHRRERIRWMDHVIADCQRLGGLLEATMTRDEVLGFLRIGSHLERADMTTRVLDVQAGHLMADSDRLGAYRGVAWLGVLRSLAAHQAYRRRAPAGIQGPEVLRFLLQDHRFPRSVGHCLRELSSLLCELSDHETAVDACDAAQRMVDSAKVRTLAWDGLHDYVDTLQHHLGEVHQRLELTYFHRDPTRRSPMAASA